MLFIFYITIYLFLIYSTSGRQEGEVKEGGKGPRSIAKKGRRARVVVGTKEGTAGVENMFNILKEKEEGRWVYVVQNTSSAPHKELGEVLSTRRHHPLLTWVVEVVVVDLGGLTGQWLMWR